MASVTKLGPGTVEVGTAPLDFSCEVLGAAITHEYEETSESVTTLCGDVTPASETRRDGFTAEVQTDLYATGLYQFVVTNDMTEQTFKFVPNTGVGTVAAAEWAGTVVVKLPAEVGADEYGSPLVGTIEWDAVGLLTFTPASDV
jgi:hypothetical protein